MLPHQHSKTQAAPPAAGNSRALLPPRTCQSPDGRADASHLALPAHAQKGMKPPAPRRGSTPGPQLSYKESIIIFLKDDWRKYDKHLDYKIF